MHVIVVLEAKSAYVLGLRSPRKPITDAAVDSQYIKGCLISSLSTQCLRIST
jgi:hypothetical protein